MFLSIDVHGKSVKLKLDWGQNTWQVQDDFFGAWKDEISAAQQGAFVRKDWNVLWINETVTGKPGVTRLVIWDAPQGETDALHVQGLARVHEPLQKQSSLRNAKLPWTTKDVTETSSSVREAIVKELEAAFKGKDTTALLPGEQASKRLVGTPPVLTQGTNCYILGGALAGIALRHERSKGALKTKVAGDQYIKSFSLSSTTGLPGRAKNNSWRDADGTALPLPGDFFALLKENMENTKENRAQNMSITHVGAILQIQSHTTWITADFGQVYNPGGVGMKRKRTYDPEKNTLTSPGSAYGPRLLAGWVDVAEHFK